MITAEPEYWCLWVIY